MKIEVLYIDGCPSHEAFLPRLSELFAQVGIDGPIERRCVGSEAEAKRERFLGSPTVRVDGTDIDPGADERGDYGLKCRLYPSPRGLRGIPPEDWVLDALQRAATTG
jgi:hypothetical protein